MKSPRKMIQDVGNVELFELFETEPETQCKECLRPHGHRYGKTKEQRDHHIAHNLRKRCIVRRFKGIPDRFLKDPEFRESQLEHDRTEEVCIQMDKDAQKDFTYHMTHAEYFGYRKNWWISLNKSGKIGPMRDRSDFTEASTKLCRLHQESGEEQLAPILFWQYQKWHPSSSTSWWQWNRFLVELMTSATELM